MKTFLIPVYLFFPLQSKSEACQKFLILWYAYFSKSVINKINQKIIIPNKYFDKLNESFFHLLPVIQNYRRPKNNLYL